MADTISVRLPDGRVIKNVPKGITQEELYARLADAGVIAPRQREPQAPEYDPSAGGGTLQFGPWDTGIRTPEAVDRFLAGAGKAAVDTGRGLRQVGAEAGNLAGLVSDETVQRLRAEQDEINRRDAPLMATGAGLAGNIGGNLAVTLAPVGLAARGAQAAGLARTAAAGRAFINPATYGAAAASGALQGAIRPVGTDESRAGNTALGAAFGVAGNAAANALGRIAQPLRGKLSGDDAQAVRTLERAGVPLDSAQRTGNRALQRVKAAVNDNPATVNAQAAFFERQQTAFNRAALKEIGENADAATPDVLSRAAKRIGSYFDAVQERVPLKIDAKLGQDVQEIMQGARDTLMPDEYALLERVMGVVQKRGERGALTGQQYQRIKQALDAASARGGPLGNNARDLREVFDGALERSARGTTDFKLLKDARRQWRALKQIEDAAARNEAGNISPARLFNVLTQKKNRWEGMYGRGNARLVGLARAGKRVLGEKTPNSGTPARIAAQLGPAAIVGVGSGVVTGDYETAAKLAAATYLAPKAGQMLLTNPALGNYLSGGMQAGALRNLLMAPTQNALLGTATRQLPIAAGLPLTQ